MTLSEAILKKYRHLEGKSIVEIMGDKLKSDFLGKKSAKNRKILLSHCRYFDDTITDRKMREIYNANFPMAWCRKGIYMVDDIEELHKSKRTRKKTIDSHQKFIDKVLLPHIKYLKKKKNEEERKKREEEARMSGQMGLF